jgi:hypothetical protein
VKCARKLIPRLKSSKFLTLLLLIRGAIQMFSSHPLTFCLMIAETFELVVEIFRNNVSECHIHLYFSLWHDLWPRFFKNEKWIEHRRPKEKVRIWPVMSIRFRLHWKSEHLWAILYYRYDICSSLLYPILLLIRYLIGILSKYNTSIPLSSIKLFSLIHFHSKCYWTRRTFSVPVHDFTLA